MEACDNKSSPSAWKSPLVQQAHLTRDSLCTNQNSGSVYYLYSHNHGSEWLELANLPPIVKETVQSLETCHFHPFET